MRQLLIAPMAFLILVPWATWAADLECDTLPANSLVRVECERNAARMKKPPPDPGSVTIGEAPENPLYKLYKMYNITEILRSDIFCGNPYQYLGQNVFLQGLKFTRTLGPGTTTFATPGKREILISGLPLDQPIIPGIWYSFVVSPLGVTQGQNAMGGPVTTPHALYLGGL